MAEPLSARHPLEHLRPALDRLTRELAGPDAPGADRLRVELDPQAGAVDLRLPPGGAAPRAAADVLGHALPAATGAWSALDREGRSRAHRLGPDQWLVTHDEVDAGPLERALRDALRHHGGTATEVSAALVGLRVSGTLTRELLSFGCSLDLRPAALGPGSCAQTVVWQAPTLLVVDADGVRLLVRTSFAGHLVARLLDAARELRPDPALVLT